MVIRGYRELSEPSWIHTSIYFYDFICSYFIFILLYFRATSRYETKRSNVASRVAGTSAPDAGVDAVGVESRPIGYLRVAGEQQDSEMNS